MKRYAAPVLLAIATALAYLSSFWGVFVHDDRSAIVENPAIRSLFSSIAEALPKGGGMTLAGRPLSQFSFAVNYALHGLDLWGFHLANLAVHIIAALTLYALVKRTLDGGGDGGGGKIAFFAALLWALHPLNTESVTYIVQRAEALAGLACLLTLYLMRLGDDTGRERLYYPLAALACLAGVLSKESAAAIPVIALLYDRAFLSDSFGKALSRRRYLHAALFASWAPLGMLMLKVGDRANTVGFGVHGGPWAYLLTQFKAISLYLRLALWPAPLSIEYGTGRASSLAEVWPEALLILALLAGTALLWRRDPKTGFWAALFWTALAPTSSVVPIAHAVVEHRTYLALGGLTTLAVIAAFRLARTKPSGGVAAGTAFALAAVALGSATFSRNLDYSSLVNIWRTAVLAAPENPRSRVNYANALIEAAQLSASGPAEAEPLLMEAKAQLELALKMDPGAASARIAYGNLLEGIGQPQLAIGQYEEALRLGPRRADVYNNLGVLYMRLGMAEEGIMNFREALIVDPDFAAARENLARAAGGARMK